MSERKETGFLNTFLMYQDILCDNKSDESSCSVIQIIFYYCFLEFNGGIVLQVFLQCRIYYTFIKMRTLFATFYK